jgi:hypothetical protein
MSRIKNPPFKDRKDSSIQNNQEGKDGFVAKNKIEKSETTKLGILRTWMIKLQPNQKMISMDSNSRSLSLSETEALKVHDSKFEREYEKPDHRSRRV